MLYTLVKMGYWRIFLLLLYGLFLLSILFLFHVFWDCSEVHICLQLLSFWWIDHFIIKYPFLSWKTAFALKFILSDEYQHPSSHVTVCMLCLFSIIFQFISVVESKVCFFHTGYHWILGFCCPCRSFRGSNPFTFNVTTDKIRFTIAICYLFSLCLVLFVLLFLHYCFLGCAKYFLVNSFNFFSYTIFESFSYCFCEDYI